MHFFLFLIAYSSIFFLIFILIFIIFSNISERTTTLGANSLIKIMKTKAWDGKDASPPQEEAIEASYLDADEIEII